MAPPMKVYTNTTPIFGTFQAISKLLKYGVHIRLLNFFHSSYFPWNSYFDTELPVDYCHVTRWLRFWANAKICCQNTQIVVYACC